MDIKEIQGIIDAMIEKSKVSLQDKVLTIKRTESMIDYQKIKDYIKKDNESKIVFRTFYKKFHKLFIYSKDNTIKVRLKKDNSLSDYKESIYIINLKVKDVSKIEEAVLFCTKLYTIDDSYEIFELLGVTEKQYLKLTTLRD